MLVEPDGAAAADLRSASPDGAGARRSALVVRGAPPDAVGAVAAEHGVALSELVAVSRSLEDAFLELTAEAA
jgi:ABC-2 type transport system ATP-binding protein